MKWRSIRYLPLNCEAPKYRSDSQIQMFLNTLKISHEIYEVVSHHVIWIILNAHFEFFFYRLRLQVCRNAFVLPGQNLANHSRTTLSYGTVSINGTYHFLLFVQRFFLHRNKGALNNENVSHFPPYFTFNARAFKSYNSYGNRIKRYVLNFLNIHICYNFSHERNKITYSNATYWKTLRTFVPSIEEFFP